MDRAVSLSEAAVLHWLLDNASICDTTSYRKHSLESLHVVGGCDCGCKTMKFKPDALKAGVIAHALALYADGKEAGLNLWGRDGEIVELEIYDCDRGAAQRFPQLANLCRWEELTSRRPKRHD